MCYLLRYLIPDQNTGYLSRSLPIPSYKAFNQGSSVDTPFTILSVCRKISFGSSTTSCAGLCRWCLTGKSPGKGYQDTGTVEGEVTREGLPGCRYSLTRKCYRDTGIVSIEMLQVHLEYHCV